MNTYVAGAAPRSGGAGSSEFRKSAYSSVRQFSKGEAREFGPSYLREFGSSEVIR